MYDDPKLTTDAKLARKLEIIAQLRAQHEALKVKWGGKSPFDEWFAEPINNAKLNTVSAYYDLVPAFAALLRSKNGDLDDFYLAVAQLGKMPIEKRHRELEKYLKQVAP